MNKTYYPQSAVEAFGRGVCTYLGLDPGLIKFNTGGVADAYTDGKSITLPAMTGPMDEEGFLSNCATAAHEASHIAFDTVPFFKRFIDKGPKAEARYRASAMNAVMDVHDETRMEHLMPGLVRLFGVSHRLVYDEALSNGICDSPDVDPVDMALTCGILTVRPPDHQGSRSTRPHPDEMIERLEAALGPVLKAKGVGEPFSHFASLCGQVLRRAKFRKQFNKGARKRSVGESRALNECGERLVRVLRPLFDAGFGRGSGQGSGQGPGKGNSGMTYGGRAGVPKDAKPGNGPSAGDKVLSDAEGAQAAENVMNTGKTGTGPQSSQSSKTNAPNLNTTSRMEQYGLDRRTLDEFSNFIGSTVQSLMTAREADGLVGGLLSGPRLDRDLCRVSTDGRVFARRNGEGEQLRVAIVVDRSASMGKTFYKVCGLAEAMARKLVSAGAEVTRIEFGVTVSEVTEFGLVPTQDATDTPNAIKQARTALAGRGKRVAIVLTDGEPNGPHSDPKSTCRRACMELRSDGVNIIGIAYEFPVQSLMETMPGAEIARADSPQQLALVLNGIAAKMEE